MTLESKIKEKIIEEYKSLRAFTQYIDEPYTSISSMLKRENGISGAAVTTVIKMCKALNIDVEALTKGEIKEKLILVDAKLTQSEEQHINHYRQLSNPGKQLIEKSVNELLAYESEFKKATSDNLINIDQYKRTVPLLGIVSAGNGIENFFDKEDVEVENDCHFALIVRGDSMEPAYHDEQIIGIKKQNALENGEIGIVEWTSEDGSRKAYLKKWYQMNGHIKLVSLNKDYDDIIIEKGKIEVRGKVAE